MLTHPLLGRHHRADLGVPSALAATIKPFANNSESARFFLMRLDDGMDPGGRITESGDLRGQLRW